MRRTTGAFSMGSQMKIYRAGIIGCGVIFMLHAYPLHMLKNVESKAVCDIKLQALSINVISQDHNNSASVAIKEAKNRK